MNDTSLSEVVRQANVIVYRSAVGITILSIIALVVNAYLLNCSRYLRRPVGVNLRLCVSLTASDALCAFFYILTYSINVIIPENFSDVHFSNCWPLLIEVFKLSTFFASVFTLLALALNHYVGIVYPLHRHAITPQIVRCAIALAYFVPSLMLLFIFSVLPGGFQAPVKFGFFSSSGCANATIYKNFFYRWVLVAPFIVFVLLISYFYLHIIIHMRQISSDPLLKANKKKRTTNRKLLITLMLLVGSACIGWLPTTVLYVLTCDNCLIQLGMQAKLYLSIGSQVLNVIKLIADAFIYASRLVEIRYAMWSFHSQTRIALYKYIGRRYMSPDVPREFVKYLSETKENRSMRSRRLRNGFDSLGGPSIVSKTSKATQPEENSKTDSIGRCPGQKSCSPEFSQTKLEAEFSQGSAA